MRTIRSVALLALVGCGRIGFDEICSIDGPCIARVTINDGATYARAPRLSVGITVSNASEVRVTEAPCVDSVAAWLPYDAAQTYSVLVEPVDGAKRICAWARDATGTTTNREATIVYETANLPVVEAFDVMQVGAQMHVTWTVSDVEGLAAQPVELDVRTGTDWIPLATALGEGGTRSSGSIDLQAPTPPYIVRITATDRAGNRGVRGTSDIIGAPGWSIYAGTIDDGIGAAPRSLMLEFAANTAYLFAVDPASMDAYVVDRDDGVIRIDGATGDTSLFIGYGTPNLPDDGVLPANPLISTNPSVHVGPDGMVYVSASSADDFRLSATLYQIDPATRHCRKVFGGGAAIDATATATTAYIDKWIWTFDEDGSLYYIANCTPGTTTDPRRSRILKATRQAGGSFGPISVVAGNCAVGTLAAGGPYDPISNPLPAYDVFAGIGTLAVADHGNTIYIGSYPGRAWKLINGQLFSSDIKLDTEGSLALDPLTHTVLGWNNGLHEYAVGGSTPSDPEIGVRVAQVDGGPCTEDGTTSADACIQTGYGLQATTAGLFFADGTAINAQRAYRLRFVDRAGEVQTYAGSHGLHGDGLSRRLLRSDLTGIYYKPATAPNTASFPAGLYFVDQLDLLLGRIDATTGLVSVEWGNRSGTPHTYMAGDAIGPNQSLGFPYAEGNMALLGFDETTGLPLLRYGPNNNDSWLLSADPTRHAVPLSLGGNLWETSPDGTSSSTLELWPYGGLSNLTVYNNTLFLLGGYTFYNPTAVIMRIGLGPGGTTKRLMGAGTDGFSADTTTPANASLTAMCHDDYKRCYTRYDAATDRLYFSEDARVRYLTTPFGATQTLVTLFSAPGDVHNFVVRPNGAEIYYANGSLRCHAIMAGGGCDDSALGPPSILGGLDIGPDQLTWIDNSTLLVSTYTGMVLQYTPP